MSKLKIMFMGTPEYALPVLEALDKEYDLVAVVTQPDSFVGRKKKLTKSPVKIYAEEHNIKILQPVKLRNEIELVNGIDCDIIITCAYGQIIPEDILYKPKYHTVNVHGSLLPKYRGGAPIEHAILNGEKKTGITIMYSDKGMDSGDIISQEEIDILDTDNLDTLKEKLSILGKDLLIKKLPDIINNKASRIKQNENEVTYAPIIKREDEYLNFNDKATNIHNKVRALSTNGTYVVLDNQEIKIFETKINDNIIDSIPGTITNIYKDGIGVATKDNEIVITKLQIPGKKIMLVKDYLNGINKNELLNKKFN